MPTVKATAILAHASGLPKDEDDMTFIFDSEDVSAAALASALAAANVVDHFFITSVGTHPVGYYIGGGVSRGADACRIEYTDITTHLDGSSAGPPFRTDTFTMPASSGATDLPNEAAVVLTTYGSLRAAAPVLGPVSSIPTDRRAQNEGAPATHSGKTHPKQSRTGRIYVGPLNSSALSSSSGEPRVSSAFLSDLGASASHLRAVVLGLSVPTTWVVWSRKLASVDDVIGGHIDNEFDTQRRRGLLSTVRSLWS